MSLKKLRRNSAAGTRLKEIKKLENKLRTTRELTARNNIISQLNSFMRQAGKNLKYKHETQEDQNKRDYDELIRTAKKSQ